MADAGSKPATSTTCRDGSDRSRPQQASIRAACSVSSNPSHVVHDGPDRSSAGHNFVTSGTHSSQDLVDQVCESLRSHGTRDCHTFRKRIFRKHEALARELSTGYLDTVKEKSYVDANRNLMRISDRLQIHDLNLSAGEEEIKRFCKRRASDCIDFANRHNYSEESYSLVCELALHYSLKPPEPKDYQADLYPCIKRMTSARWWRKKVYCKQRQTIESVARDMGLVCQQRNAYSSQYSQEVRSKQKAKNAEYLANTFIENDEGQQYCLKDLHDRSVSNPFIRRAELMTRIKGFEMVADQLDHCGEFYTLTTPSRMHARLKKGGANPKYDGTTPDEAHQYLTNLFCCIRSKLHRDGLKTYGLRVVEPNHDGTPHWHLLLFMAPDAVGDVRNIFRNYALQTDGDERGAAQHRFKAEAIDKKKGTAAGYVAKYISKNIDGNHIDTDLHGNNATESARAIDAWASTYNIRQFQFIGGPSVTVWRELRRLAESEQAQTITPKDSPALFDAMLAADAAEWAAYVMLMGGPNMRASDRPIRPLYEEIEPVDMETGEINPDALTEYGDPKSPKIIGLVCDAAKTITRWRTWTLIPSIAASAHSAPAPA